MRRGLLIVISGPSGVGKDTVIRRLRELDPSLAKSVSFTTRARRPGEISNVDYVYTTRADLEALKDQLLESAEYDGNVYATSATKVNELRSEGKDTILKIDVQGAEQVRKLEPHAVLIFIKPPSMEELERRLQARRTESPKDIAARRAIAEREMGYANQYDYVVVNDVVNSAAREVLRIINRARERQT